MKHIAVLVIHGIAGGTYDEERFAFDCELVRNYDVFQFTCMQILMSMELGIELGTYTHIAGSLHLYGRNYVNIDNE